MAFAVEILPEAARGRREGVPAARSSDGSPEDRDDTTADDDPGTMDPDITIVVADDEPTLFSAES